MTIFYVYQLNIEGSDAPFYVGKGKYKRAWSHLNPYKDDFSYKANTIRKAQREGKSIQVSLLVEGLEEPDALELEKYFIGTWGRKDQGLGPLLNETDGGEGMSNPSDRTRAMLSKAQKGRKHSESQVANRAAALKGKKRSEESRARISNSQLGRKASEETKNKMSMAHAGSKHNMSTVECPHCGKSGGANTMKRWHFDNCKYKE